MWSVLKIAARAGIWRTTAEPRLVGLATLLGWATLLAAVRIAFQYMEAGSAPNFNPYGLNAIVAWVALDLVIAGLLVRPAGRITALSAMMVLLIVAGLAAAPVRFGLPWLAAALGWTDNRIVVIATVAIFVLEIVWWFGAMVCVLRSLEAQSRVHAAARVAAVVMAIFVVNTVVPHAPVFIARDFDIRNANWWEYLRARFEAEAQNQAPSAPKLSPREASQIEQSQGALVKAEADRLAPQRDGVTDVYVIGVAGWADQDVFVKELDGALAQIGNVLPIKDHVVRLINHRETMANVPLANLANFVAAAHAVGEAMDKDEDILLLLMTSHGGQSGFALQLPGSPMIELTPQQVASTLDAEGIKNRIVIVSACYSGIFVPPLANDDTIVMTAADARSTSFGCAPEREWTYFGDALFKQSMLPGADFQQAFEHARVLIRGWEMMDHVAPSNPQGHFGPALVEKLEALFRPTASAAAPENR